jgi:hypothetical protein
LLVNEHFPEQVEALVVHSWVLKLLAGPLGQEPLHGLLDLGCVVGNIIG